MKAIDRQKEKRVRCHAFEPFHRRIVLPKLHSTLHVPTILTFPCTEEKRKGTNGVRRHPLWPILSEIILFSQFFCVHYSCRQMGQDIKETPSSFGSISRSRQMATTIKDVFRLSRRTARYLALLPAAVVRRREATKRQTQKITRFWNASSDLQIYTTKKKEDKKKEREKRGNVVPGATNFKRPLFQLPHI